MEYRLHHEGRDIGVFPLEELRRRRAAGELTGAEFVWREGMENWQPLDELLGLQTAPPPLPVHAPGPTAPPAPAPAPAPVSRPAWSTRVKLVVGGAVIGTFLLAAVGMLIGYRAVRQARQVVEALREGAEGAGGAVNRPIVWNTNAATFKDVQARKREFRVRQWLDGFRERGDMNSPCAAQCVQMLQAWISENYGTAPGEEAAPTAGPVNVHDLCDRLVSDPACQDPLMLTIAGVECTRLQDQRACLDRALQGYGSSRHRAYPRFYAAASVNRTVWGDSLEIRNYQMLAMNAFKEMWKDGSILPGDQPELAEILTSGWGETFFQMDRRTVLWEVTKAGPSYRWLELMLRGHWAQADAWMLRGSGFSDSVTPQGWAGFTTNMAEAREHFTAAWKLHPEWALAPARMVAVAMSDSGAAEMRRWFDRAVAVEMENEIAWHNLRWGLRPRWHGSLEALTALGQAAVDTGRFDTDVPRKLFDVMTDLEAESNYRDGRHIYGQPDLWPYVQRMYEGYIEVNGTNADGWRRTYAVVASLAGHYDAAREQLAKVDWRLSEHGWYGWGRDLSLLTWEVAARTGAEGESVTRAEQLSEQRPVKEAIQAYQKVAASTNADSRTHTFAQHRLAALALEAQLEQGGWVNFMPSHLPDPAWTVPVGNARVLTDGALEVEAGPRGHLLFARARVGPEFEVKGEFESTGSSTAEYQAGLVLGLPELETTDWLGFRLLHGGQRGDAAAFSLGWSRSQTTEPTQLKPERNTFTFRLEKNRATATVNGVEVLRQVLPGQYVHALRRDAFVGFGAHNNQNETVLRYRNVQVRRLHPGVIPPAATPE